MNKYTYQKLVSIIKTKKTAVCLSLDTDTMRKGEQILEICAPYICMVKLHPELFSDWDSHTHPQLIKQWSVQYNILIMLDAKLVDVPEISYKFLTNTYYRPNEWADMVTVMSVNYVAITNYLRTKGVHIATIPVTEMNTGSPLFALSEYQQFVKNTVLSVPGIIGIINQKTYSSYQPTIPSSVEFNSYSLIGHNTNINNCQEPEPYDDIATKETILKMTPGVVVYGSEITDNISSSRYRTIRDAMVRDGNDIVIIGGSLINSNSGNSLINSNSNSGSLTEKNELLIEKAKDAAYESIQYSKFV